MYNGTVTNIENTERAVQSCNSWLRSFLLPALLLIILYISKILFFLEMSFVSIARSLIGIPLVLSFFFVGWGDGGEGIV